MSLKPLARIIANCPEKTPKLCVDDIKHSVGNYLETLKIIIPAGSYVMTGTDYNKQEEFEGNLSASHDESSIHLESNLKFLHGDGLEIARAGTISTDSTHRGFYSSSTTRRGARVWSAQKSMKCVSMDNKSVTLTGYGSSTSTEKYHCGATIKKVITKTGDDSFRVETYLGDQKAYQCDYKQRID